MPEIKLKLKPFTVPNYVHAELLPGLRQDGIVVGQGWALKDVDPLILAEMCDEFRREVFRKAEAIDPEQD